MVSHSTRQNVLKELDELMNETYQGESTYKNTTREAEIPMTPPGFFSEMAKTQPTMSKTGKAPEAPVLKALPILPALEMPVKCPFAQGANSSFTVFCNQCSRPISNAHYHCGVCDDGDFDLCLDCIGKGMSCDGERHWMIKRTIENGKVSNSTTETLPPKTTHYNNSKTTLVEPEEEEESVTDDMTRTCNCCIQGKSII